MGTGGVRAAVVDAGPLIHLKEIDKLGLFQVFDVLLVPEAVWTECVKHERVQQQDLFAITNLQRHTLDPAIVEQFIEANSLAHLQAGEVECLCLCCHQNVDTILTDDLAARDAAKRLYLTPVGSLGIVVKAFHRNLILLQEAEVALADLYDVSSLYVTRAVVEMAIEQLQTRFGRV